MISPKIVVLDFGSGNIHSVVSAFEEVGATVELTSDRAKALAADGLVIPGVGAFATVMEQLNAVGAPSIVDQRLSAGKAVFGICVGLQVMFETGTEHDIETEGLGQWPGSVTKLDAPTLPHIGWNDVEVPSGSKLLKEFLKSSSTLCIPMELPVSHLNKKQLLKNQLCLGQSMVRGLLLQ